MYIFPFISFLGSKSLVSQNFAYLCFLSWCSTLCDSLYRFLAVLIWISTCHEAAIIQASLWISLCQMQVWRKWLHIRTWSIFLFPSFYFLIFSLVHMLSCILTCTVSISKCFWISWKIWSDLQSQTWMQMRWVMLPSIHIIGLCLGNGSHVS